MRWAASDFESVELNPLHIGPEYLAELGQIAVDRATWSEQLDMRLVVASAETVLRGGSRCALADNGRCLQTIDIGA